MRTRYSSTFIPAVVLATLGAFTVAPTFAFADTADGTIQSIDPAGGFVTLDNGMKYDLSAMDNHGDVLDNFKTGDTVSINYANVGTGTAVNSISPVSPNHTVAGTIDTLDQESGHVTVAGLRFDMSQSPDFRTKLDNFKEGDTVQVSYGLVGSGLAGIAISPMSAPDNSIDGALTRVDSIGGTVTLKGGIVVKFDDSALKSRLDTFKEGDMVHVSYVHEGDALIGESISPAG